MISAIWTHPSLTIRCQPRGGCAGQTNTTCSLVPAYLQVEDSAVAYRSLARYWLAMRRWVFVEEKEKTKKKGFSLSPVQFEGLRGPEEISNPARLRMSTHSPHSLPSWLHYLGISRPIYLLSLRQAASLTARSRFSPLDRWQLWRGSGNLQVL